MYPHTPKKNIPWNKDKLVSLDVDSKREEVDLLRIFIIESDWGQEDLNLAKNIVKKHVDSGVPVQIIVSSSYIDAGQSETDLEDFVIFDGKLTGHIEHDSKGGIKYVVYSTEPGLIRERELQFKRLKQNSMIGSQWLRHYEPAPANAR